MITPLDIENKKFSKQMMNGYSVEEVDDFLDDLTVDYTKNYKEATELKAKVAELTKSLEHYKNIESTLQNTLVMAQKTADDVKNIAKQQADQIIREAEGTAKSSLDSINQSIILKQREKDEMEKPHFLARQHQSWHESGAALAESCSSPALPLPRPWPWKLRNFSDNVRHHLPATLPVLPPKPVVSCLCGLSARSKKGR